MPPPSSPSSCRLYVILARDGRSAVVFRRGPSRHVAILRWWLSSDTVELGQWFHGRIYERRCDLSPDGELMVYFAAKYGAPLATWTAISRPPFLTALALWPNGSGWGGGGLFATNMRLGLNHRPDRCLAAPDSKCPHGFSASPYAEYAGHGEDDPICFHRMSRDGWTVVAQGRPSPYRADAAEHWTFAEPEIYERAQPRHPRPHKSPASASPIVLRRELRGIGVRNGPWYREQFSLHDAARNVRLIEDCEWADWDATGDLLFAARGRLYRLSARDATSGIADPASMAKPIVDLRSLAFETIECPPDGRKWPRLASDRVHGRLIPAAS